MTADVDPVAWRTRPADQGDDFMWVYLDRREQAEDFQRQGWVVEALDRLPRQNCPLCGGFLPDERNGGEFTCPKCGTEFAWGGRASCLDSSVSG